MLNSPSARHVDAFPRLIEWGRSVCIALMALVVASPAIAEKGKLRERLTPEVMAVVYPGAERLGVEGARDATRAPRPMFRPWPCGRPLFETPFDDGGVDLDRRITGAKAVSHNENYIVTTPVVALLDTFLALAAVPQQRHRSCRWTTSPVRPSARGHAPPSRHRGNGATRA